MSSDYYDWANEMESNSRSIDNPNLMLWCPICTWKEQFGISAINSPKNRMSLKVVRDRDGYVMRHFWGCTNFPACKFSTSDGRGSTDCLTTYDIEDDGPFNLFEGKLERAHQKLSDREEPEFYKSPKDGKESLNNIEIKLLQQQFIMLSDKITQLEKSNAELKKIIDENEERRKKLGFEVF